MRYIFGCAVLGVVTPKFNSTVSYQCARRHLFSHSCIEESPEPQKPASFDRNQITDPSLIYQNFNYTRLITLGLSGAYPPPSIDSILIITQRIRMASKVINIYICL
jgi:hypothetical protein